MTPYEAILAQYPPLNQVKTDAYKSMNGKGGGSFLIAVYPQHLLSSEDHTGIIVIEISHEEQLRLHAFFTRWNIERTISSTEKGLFQRIATRAPIRIIDLTDPTSIPWLETNVFGYQASE